eukprot:5164460-Ditylum_brightwellii.AAC.1
MAQGVLRRYKKRFRQWLTKDMWSLAMLEAILATLMFPKETQISESYMMPPSVSSTKPYRHHTLDCQRLTL